jgi:hypothetical protein
MARSTFFRILFEFFLVVPCDLSITTRPAPLKAAAVRRRRGTILPDSSVVGTFSPNCPLAGYRELKQLPSNSLDNNGTSRAQRNYQPG